MGEWVERNQLTVRQGESASPSHTRSQSRGSR